MRHALGILLLLVLALGGYLLFAGTADAPPPDATPTTTDARHNGPADAADADANANANACDPDAAGAADATIDRSAAPHEGTAAAPFIRVRVRDADRNPIEGATVETFADSVPGLAKTRADGWTTLGVAPGKGDLRMLVCADVRHAQAMWTRQKELTVTLPWSGPVLGRVVDALTGAPVAGATVTRRHDACRNCEPDQAKTAADGTFTLPAVLRNEDLTFGFEHPDYPRQTVSLRIPGRGEPLTHTFVLQRGEVIAGRCVDLDTHRPIADADVRVGDDAVAKTAVDGTFRVLVRPDADRQAWLRLHHDGHTTVVFAVTAPQPDTSVEYPLPAAVSLRGRVHTSTGTPIANAAVRVMPSRQAEPPKGLPAGARIDADDYRAAKTDDQGAFEETGLVRGSTYRVWPRCEGYSAPATQPRRGIEVVATPDTPPVDLVLEPTTAAAEATIAGTFRLNGQPASGQLTCKVGNEQRWSSIGDDGEFKVEHVPAGTAQLTVSVSRYDNADDQRVRLTREAEVHAGDALQLALELTVAEAPVTGHVTDADGKPAIEVWVSARPKDTSTDIGGLTDEQGNYTLPIPACFAASTVRCSEAKARESVVPGTSGVDFVQGPRGSLLVRTTRDDGQLVEASIALRRGNEKFFNQVGTTAPDPDGFVSIRCTPGDYLLVVSAQDCVPLVQQVTAAAGARLDLRLQRGTTITVVLAEKHPDGEAPRVRLQDAGLEELADMPPWLGHLRVNRRCTPTTTGTVLRGFAPGRHRLTMGGRYEPVPEFVDVGAEPVTVEVSWRVKPEKK